MREYSKNNVIRKIWVCGAPLMNEEFDRSLAVICPKMNLSPNIYEIM